MVKRLKTSSEPRNRHWSSNLRIIKVDNLLRGLRHFLRNNWNSLLHCNFCGTMSGNEWSILYSSNRFLKDFFFFFLRKNPASKSEEFCLKKIVGQGLVTLITFFKNFLDGYLKTNRNQVAVCFSYSCYSWLCYPAYFE